MKRKSLFLIIPAMLGIMLSGCRKDPKPIENQDFENVSFNDATYVYDGSAHQLDEVSGVPEGTIVTYTGRDSQIDVGVYPATALLSKEGYNDKTLHAALSITPATFENIVFADKTVEYNGQEFSITCSNVPSFATVTYQNNRGTEVGTYFATATISAPNYNDLTLTATLSITKGTIKGVTYNNGLFTYDGNEHTLLVSGTLPSGVTVEYENNKRTNAGSQEATARLSGEGYNTLVLHATLTITKAIFTGITFNDLTVEYDGQVHTLTASGVPSFATVSYQNNSATIPGIYNATVTISADNYEDLVLNAQLKIVAKTITGIEFNDQEFEYDGSEHNLSISGILPAGASVSYENNGRTAVGSQEVTATISGTGYETVVLHATLTINPKEITGVTFENGYFDYDGNEHSIFVSGTLPEGVTASYTDNTRTEVGPQYASVTLSGEGYQSLTLYAVITIYDPADQSDTLRCLPTHNKFLNSDTEFGNGTATLTSNRGLDIEFAYEGAKGGDSTNWLVLDVGGSIYNTTPVESFTDLDLSFANGRENFRVYYSYEPVFDSTHFEDYQASSVGYKSTKVLEDNQPSYFKITNIDEEPIYFEEMYVYLDRSITVPTLTVTSNNNSYGTVSGGGKTKVGNNVTVTATPTSSSYCFDSWYLDGEMVSIQPEYTFAMPDHDVTLEAKFITKTQQDWELAHGAKPNIDEVNKTVTYGMYPKTHVNAQSVINALNAISEPEENGWYLYNDQYYAKVVGSPNQWSNGYIPEFNDGTEIYEGETYWFKVEPIEWKWVHTVQGENTYYLISEYLLDAKAFHSTTSSQEIDGKTIYANNYKYCDIRAWLNGEFFAKAFSLGNFCVDETKVYNDKSTTNNSNGSYSSDTTYDRVFLPSYKDYTNFVYGFSGDESRRAFCTDYARAVGISYMSENNDSEGYVKFSSTYWTRSPDNTTFGSSYAITTVQTTGYISGLMANDNVNTANIGVRVAISLDLTK